jgi:GDP-L-fucose synthase
MINKKKNFDLKDKSIFIAGHNGMVGNAALKELQSKSKKIYTVEKSQLDLRDEYSVSKWFEKNKPQVVVNAAAMVGGIHANSTFPVDFLENNLRIQNNIIKGSYNTGVEKLLFLGSSCIYPRDSPQPIKEEYLFSGYLEPTNEWYAIAKLAGIKLCQAYQKQYNCDYISLIPTNLYGPNDNFHPIYSHVPAALIRRFHEAKVNKLKSVSVWGTGNPRREFLHVSDLAKAIIFMLEYYSSDKPINIGTGLDVSIHDFAKLISQVVGYKGQIVFDHSKPDGMQLKRLDISKATSIGWHPQIDLNHGLKNTYEWALKNIFI